MSEERKAKIVRARVLVTGVVQGVGFRYATAGEARRLGLTGWVRNTSDGRVEILAEGQTDRIGQLVAWCRIGPSGARVSEVERRDESPDGTMAGFQILV